MKSKAIISAAVCTAALALAAPGVASASVGVDNASSFTSNGTLRDGWYWVHQDTESAAWTFNITSLVSAKPGKVYLNVDALVTNRPTGGGSGHSAKSARFVASCGQARQVLIVKLVNPFRPVFDGDTFGVGYAASGHSASPLKMNRFAGCTQLEIRTQGAYAQQRAIGFRQASAYLGYS